MAKAEPLATFTLYAASRNFGAERNSLAAKLAKAGEQPDKDGGYTVKQINTAIYSDYAAEKKRLTTEQADKIAIENRLRRGELMEVPRIVEIIQRVCFAARQIIMLSPLSNDDKAKTLTEFQRLRDLDLTAPLPDEAE